MTHPLTECFHVIANGRKRVPPPPRLFTTVVGRVLGLLLLIAAGLKAYGFGVDPVARLGIFSTPAFQLLIIMFELSLGVWLLSGQQSAGAWLVVLSTFLIFAGVSFYQGWVGQASCGCLGRRVSVNPWVMFGVDSAAVVAILIFRPDFRPLWDSWARIAVSAAGVSGGYVLLLGSLAGFAVYYFGSIDAALAFLRNERLSIYPAMVDMGRGVPGEIRDATIEITNRTEHSVRLVGGTADCSCTVIGDLPVTIPPGESRSISIQVRLPSAQGLFNRKAQLTIDDEGLKRVGFHLTGRITKQM